MDLTRAREWPKGRHFEDFRVGDRFEHHWGRTVAESDSLLWSSLTLAFNPLYFNRPYALALDHPDLVVNPYLVFAVVFGLSVEDLSEKGGVFLGVEGLEFLADVHPGDTLTAASEVIAARESQSHPGHGVVTWHTRGFDQGGRVVIDFTRSNLVVRRAAP